MKLLFWVLIGLVVFAWFVRSKKPLTAPDPPPPGGDGSATEAMVQCARCGVHVPASEAVAGASGALFCSQEHRRLGEARR